MKALAAVMPAYWPSLYFFWNAVQCDVLVLTDHFQFTKRSSATVSAPLRLSQPALRIPVRHFNPTDSIALKVFDSGSKWQKKHIQTIRHQFHHAPYAYYYLPVLEELITDAGSSLSDFLFTTTAQLLNWLHLDVRLLRSSQLPHSGSHEALLHTWCAALDCHTCLTESVFITEQRLNPAFLKNKGIICKPFAPFPDFHILQSNRNLSILHFLMEYGPEAGYLLRQYLS